MSHRVSDKLQQSTAICDTANSTDARSTVPDLRVSYHTPAALSVVRGNVLANISFGTPPAAASTDTAQLNIHVALQPLQPTAPSVEIWHAHGPVQDGRDGAIRFAHDGQYLFAVIETDEREHGGVLATAEFMYREVRRFQSTSPYRHMWRIWNYADAFNEGAGDMERYRQFCVGRARGLGDLPVENFPAASAVGHQQVSHCLQVYWLAGSTAGVAVENPRQVSAYRYPQTYGPASPSFARATITPHDTLLISGTASILGHASHHIGDVTAQLDETLRNLDALIAQAARQRNSVLATLSAQTWLKVYVRDAAQLPQIDAHLRARLPGVTALYLGADICRRELLLEIECIQRTPRAVADSGSSQ